MYYRTRTTTLRTSLLAVAMAYVALIAQPAPGSGQSCSTLDVSGLQNVSSQVFMQDLATVTFEADISTGAGLSLQTTGGETFINHNIRNNGPGVPPANFAENSFAYSQPVTDFAICFYDIERRSTNNAEFLEVTFSNGGVVYEPVASEVIVGDLVEQTSTVSPLAFVGTVGQIPGPVNSTDPLGSVCFEVAGPVDRIDFDYAETYGTTGGPGRTFLYDPPTACLQATTVLVSDFRGLTSLAGERIVEWTTASEAGTLGFKLLRETSGGWRPVGPPLVASSTGQGAAYRIVDPKVQNSAARYVLAEHLANGGVNILGPYEVNFSTEALGELSEGSFPRRHSEPSRSVAKVTVPVMEGNEGTTRLRLEIGGTGMFSLDAGSIAAATQQSETWIGELIRDGRVSLLHDGRPVSWHADESSVTFFADVSPSLYSNTEPYYLEIERSGRQMNAVAGRPQGAPVEDSQSSLVFEEDLVPAIVSTFEEGVDYWHWKPVQADSSTIDVAAVEYEILDPAPGEAAVIEVHLVSAVKEQEQHAEVRLNGMAVGTVSWIGRSATEFSIDPDQVLETNLLEVEALFNSENESSLFWLDRFSVVYGRETIARSDVFDIRTESHLTAEVVGFSSPDVQVYDVTHPNRPKRVEGVTIESSELGYSAAFRSRDGDRRYWLTTQSAKRAVEGIYPDSVTAHLNSAGAEYLVIVPEPLFEAAELLAEHRRAESGLTTLVVSQQDVFDEVSFGHPTPLAIRDFVREATQRWPQELRYVVLAGSGTLDPRDILGAGDDLVTPFLGATSSGLSASDNLIADLDGDDIPDVALGRIPARTADELLAYVGKLQRYEAASGPWRDRLLALADNDDSGGAFTTQSERIMLVSKLVPDAVHLSELPIGEAREMLQTLWNDGALVVSYVGHGGVDLLASESLLTNEDLALLTNMTDLPIFLGLTCMISRFEIPGFESLGEALVRHGGGAVAVWSSTSLALSHEALVLGEALIERLATGSTIRLGDAILAAQQQVAGDHGAQTRVGFNLLGDPALPVTP